MDWVASVNKSDPHADPRGIGLAKIKVAPDANHSDPNITGCRQVTNCSKVAAAKKIEGNAVHIDGVACFSHNESQILAALQYGPLSVSIAAIHITGYNGGIINCTAAGIDHAVLLVGYGIDKSDAASKNKKRHKREIVGREGEADLSLRIECTPATRVQPSPAIISHLPPLSPLCFGCRHNKANPILRSICYLSRASLC